MTHETHKFAWEHAMAARTALEAFRHKQTEADLDWSSFEMAVRLLDRGIEELRRPVRNLPPIPLAAGGFPAAMAYLMEDAQAAKGPEEFYQQAIDADIPPKWKRAVVRITQESLANACRHSKSKRIFLELTLDGDVLHIYARDWGVSLRSDGKTPGRSALGRTCRRLKLFGGTATIDSEPGKGTFVTAEIPLLQRGDAHRHVQFRMGPGMRFGEV